MRRQFGPFLLKHCESQKGFFDSNSIFKSPHQVYSAWRRPPASETRDQTAILDSVSRPVTLPAMGIAISPRGDMLKNRVPIYARTHRVGDQLNFCGEACSPDRDASMSRIDRRSSERRFRFQSPLVVRGPPRGYVTPASRLMYSKVGLKAGRRPRCRC
jgi:hypothetical protein